MSSQQQLTSVKVDSDLFSEFKILCVRNKFSLQKLNDRCLHLFITDEAFRKKILNHSHLVLPIETTEKLT